MVARLWACVKQAPPPVFSEEAVITFCFYTHSYNGPNLVLKYNQEQKRLVNIAVDNRSSPFYALRDRQGNAIGVTACDIDGDGREEIYVLNTNNAFSGTAGLLFSHVGDRNGNK